MDAHHLRNHPPQLWMRILDWCLQIAVSQRDNGPIEPLEGVAHFGFDTAAEMIVTRERSKEEATGKGKRFHTKTAGNSGVKACSHAVFSIPIG